MSKQSIWVSLVNSGMTKFGAAGLMGNLQAESALRSTNVEDRSGISDDVYTQQVDYGIRDRYQFAHDSYGYGLAQWTFYSRKERLYDYAKSNGVSIGNEDMQLSFLIKELKEDFSNVWKVLTSATNVADASNSVLLQFERPANATAQMNYRAGLASSIYGEFCNASLDDPEAANPMSALIAMGITNVLNEDGTPVIEPVVDSGGIVLDGSGIDLVPGTTIYVSTNPEAQSVMSNTVICRPAFPCLKEGDKGIAVGMAQLALKRRGYALGSTGDNSDGVDYDFGPKMKAAVESFKSGNHISNAGSDEGIVTEETWEALWM